MITGVNSDKRLPGVHAAGLGLHGGGGKCAHGEWEGQASLLKMEAGQPGEAPGVKGLLCCSC